MGDTQTVPAEVAPDTALVTQPQKAQALIGRANQLIATSEAAPLATSDDYANGAGLLADLKSAKTALKAEWKYQDEPPLESIRRHKELFAPAHDRLTAAISAFDGRLTGYRQLQTQLAEEERKRQEEIANRERARLEAQAAAERAEAERKAREKQAKADALEATGKAGQAAKARAQAEELVEAAETKAADLESVAASVPAPIVTANIPKIAGSFGRKVWKARPKQSAVNHPNGQRKLTSTEVLILAAAEDIATGGQMNLALLLNPDMPGLNKRATALREHFNIAGFEAFAEESTVSRGRR